MKLKKTFIAQELDGTLFLVPVGGEAFHGVLRGNKTTAFIVDCLKIETTSEQITDAMCKQYNAPREIIAADVEEVLNALRSIHAIDE